MMHSYQKKFYFLNKEIWKTGESENKQKKKKKFFLIEGLLGGMPTHMFRLGIIANAFKDTTGKIPVVILRTHDDAVEKLFGSFGVSKFVYLDDIRLTLQERMDTFLNTIPHIFFRNINYLLAAEYQGLNIGHLVFDDILHSHRECFTVKRTTWSCILSFYRCIRYIKKYSKIIDKYNVEEVVLTHNEYVDYGALAVAAIVSNKTIININDLELSVSKDLNEIYYLNRLHAAVKRIITEYENKKELEEKGKRYLEERIKGEVGVFDTKNAYGNKRIYTREELSANFSHNSKKNVFIYMHVFSDAPHLSQMTMYRDYFEWVTDTINAIKNIENVNWYIKAHPSGYIYGETDIIDKMMKSMKGDFFWVPNDFSTLSIKDTADVVITCQGTIGIEASSMGVPVVITGLPYYAKFGFTIEPKTREKYYRLLHKLDKIRKLSEEKSRMARIVLGAYSEYVFEDSSILDSVVYQYAGYGKQTDYRRVYNRMSENIVGKSKEEIPLYKKAEKLFNEYVEGQKSCRMSPDEMVC